MHTNGILTNKRRTHAQSNYTDTKLKAWFRRLLRHPARKRREPVLHPGLTQGCTRLIASNYHAQQVNGTDKKCKKCFWSQCHQNWDQRL